MEVLALQPILVAQAILLAKLQEDKLDGSCQNFHARVNPPPPTPTPPPLLSPPLPSSSVSPTWLHPPKPSLSKWALKTLPWNAKKGLCYNCKDKWGSNHRCKARFFLLVAEDNDIPLEPTPQSLILDLEPPPLPNSSNTDHAQISFNALSSTSASESLRIYGDVN